MVCQHIHKLLLFGPADRDIIAAYAADPVRKRVDLIKVDDITFSAAIKSESSEQFFNFVHIHAGSDFPCRRIKVHVMSFALHKQDLGCRQFVQSAVGMDHDVIVPASASPGDSPVKFL